VKKIGPLPSSATNPPQLPLQSEIKLTMILIFLSIALMGAKMIEVEVCGLQFSLTVNGEQ